METVERLLLMRDIEMEEYNYTNGSNIVVCLVMLCYDTDRETKSRRLPSNFGGIKTPSRRKKGGRCDGYIF